MLEELRQVLRLIMLTATPRKKASLKTKGGLLLHVWAEKDFSAQRLKCTVAAAGNWCLGIENLPHDLKKILLPCALSSPEFDPEELSTFTDLYGPLRFLLTFQIKVAVFCAFKWHAHINSFLQMFNLTNAEITIHLKYTLNDQVSEQVFRAFLKQKITLADFTPLILGVSSSKQPPGGVQERHWCHGGHPVAGGRLSLSIPPQAMERGLFGELSVQVVTLLSPCVLQYPNLPVELTRLQVLVYSPSNVPIPGLSGFLQTLPAALERQQQEQNRMLCCSFKASHADLVHNFDVVFTAEEEKWDDPALESSHLPLQQSLLVFLLFKHIDPFSSEITDMMATEVLIEHHLEDILSNNKSAVTAALQTELMNAANAQRHRKKQQEKLQSAVQVILDSTMSIVSCSSNLGFRKACLECMKVTDTHKLSASVQESLQRVTTWKFLPSGRCSSAQAARKSREL